MRDASRPEGAEHNSLGHRHQLDGAKHALRAQIDDMDVLQLGEGQKELALESEEVRIEDQIPLRSQG